MKIKTEILQSVYILTCEGPSLTTSVVEVFLNSMKVLIQKNNLDILFDLSGVEAVEGANIGSVARFLETIEGHGLLIICGVNERDLNLLRMSHLSEIFILATNRNEALSTLFWEKKKKNKPLPLAPPEPRVAKEEPDASFAVDKKEALELSKEAKSNESIYELVEYAELIEYADVEEIEVVNEELPIEEKQPFCEVEEKRARRLTGEEQMKFCRIKSRKVMDGEFIIFCKNIDTGKHYTAVVDSLGIGGLFMTLSPSTISEGEILLLEGRLGKLFKFREKAVLHSRHQEKFAFQFVDLSIETTRFLNRLAAA